jgi:hypothetical protein
MNLELVTNLLQRNVPDFVSDQVQFWVDMAQEAIRRDEREQIMELLRGELQSEQTNVYHADILHGLMNRIQSGEHVRHRHSG